ncbi:AP-5 complex subunit zeta-1 [Oryzias melastigma]|uniref:AP-5 complex subunit zeta-1 n=1 Tax=Oryzias melastigma TaxID=30732 RepID=A0A834F6N9_ORYME|nr:AP-5 complex subunit zeta-1 [Oryzias melastigma]
MQFSFFKMYSHGSESLIRQAREIQDSELQKFYSRLVKLLQFKEVSHELVDSLHRLYLILSANKYSRTLPSELQQNLVPLLSSPSEQLQVLSSAVLRETLPPCGEEKNIAQLNSHAAALLLSQAGSKDDLSDLCAQLIRSLEIRPPDGPAPSLMHTLPFVNSILTYCPECLTADHVILLSKKLVDWLRYASIMQVGGASSGGFFSGSRSRQPAPIAELDGTVSGDFFTVLCVGQGFTEDQWMNVYSFSVLRHWLLTYRGVSNDSMVVDADDRSEVDGSVVSMVSATSSSSRLLSPKERLREKSFQYCQRLIEQCDRKALKKTDTDLQKACLVEAVCILDLLCAEDPSLVYRVFPCVKALFGRLSSDLSFARVLVPVAQFYLNHGEMAAVDCESVWKLVFSQFPAELFNDPFLAHDFLRFLRRGLLSLDAFRNPAFRGLFLFLLRTEAGSGDTIERLSTLHDLLAEAAEWPRVVHCAQTVPVLLHVYFNTVITVADEKLLAHLILVMLERSNLLLNMPTYCKEIHRVFSSQLLRLCKLHPSLVVDQSQELLEFAGTTANVYSKEEVYTHVVWVLGEYLSLSSDSRCSVRLITSCFESLEAVLFEITSSAPPPGSVCPAPKVITTLMSALAKLASRSHDLIPRVSLFLSKMRNVTKGGSVPWCSDEEDMVAIVTRGEELWSLLKTPGVAQSVLTPPPYVNAPRWHRDSNLALPLQLRALTALTHSP